MGGAARTGIAGGMTTLRGSVAEELSEAWLSGAWPPRLAAGGPPDSGDGDTGDGDTGDGDTGGDTGVSVKTRAKTKKPSLYKVLMLNDDYTPMEFVVYVLQRFFGMDHSRAIDIMLTVHNKGVAVVGVYPYEVAETKVTQVMDCARSNQHPLQCTLEKE